MPEGQHTPGPWNVGEPGGPAGPFYSLVNPQGNVVALQIVGEADAHLCAAAPDLLAVCKAAESAISYALDAGTFGTLSPQATDVFVRLGDAITKAEVWEVRPSV